MTDPERTVGGAPADDQLRAWLRAGDPTVSSAPASPHLDPASLEAVMNEIKSSSTPQHRALPSWVFAPAAAAAAVLLLAAIVGGGLWWTNRLGPPVAAPAPSASPVTIALRDAAQDPSASCLRAEPETMRANVDLAISGTVRTASAGSATIAVERWYWGGSGPATVVVQRPADSAPGILYSPELAAGQRVLLVATDGALHLCDPSGPWSAEAEQLYVAAFGPGTPVS